MRILVIGGGGREHAIIWRLLLDNPHHQIRCVTKNAAINKLADSRPLISYNCSGADLIIIGPETHLINGTVNLLRDFGFWVFGPTKAVAQIEGSKIFCKTLLTENNIPTAKLLFQATDPERAFRYLKDQAKFPLVIKADYLAAGKGVYVVNNLTTANQAIKEIMVDKKHGSGAAGSILMEEFLTGHECSLQIITDGETIIPLFPARDYKKLLTNDHGPNTGGMGSYAPLPDVPESLIRDILKKIIIPTLNALNKIERYNGVLYAGLMLTKDGPKVLEYNCRFGDPEAQVVLPLYAGNFTELIQATAEGLLNIIKPLWHSRYAVGITLASGGYPNKYRTGFSINGLDQIIENTLVFHAGTALNNHGKTVTAGGRVLNVVGLGPDLETARANAYQRLSQINFLKMIYRTDIAEKYKSL